MIKDAKVYLLLFDTMCQKVITVDNNVQTLYQYSILI